MAIFNGTFTMIGPNGHRTVRVKTVQTEGPLQGKRIVYLLTGPQNTFDYTGFAFVSDDGEDIKVWRKYVGTQFETIGRVFRSLVNGLPAKDGRSFADLGYRVEESRSCVKCNRLLTTPESIAKGIGPICEAGGVDPD
jgi:hypothetical protein